MSEIREGQKVKVFVDTAEGSRKEFDCSIKDVHIDRLSLNFPDEILDYSEYVEECSEVFVKIFTPVGIKIFDAVVLDSPVEGNFVIEYVENTVEIQRREYVRTQMELKVLVERTGQKGAIAYTLDVSGGGLKFKLDEDFEPNESVKLTIYMPNDRSIQARGVMIQNPYIPKYEHVLSFAEIDENDRDRIIKKCFEVQVAGGQEK